VDQSALVAHLCGWDPVCWPHLDVVGATREGAESALVIGPRTKHLDVLHPAARLPPVQEGDLLLIRRVGAYNQSESTQFAEARAASRRLSGCAPFPQNSSSASTSWRRTK
jgi:hypothetical protein